MKENVVKFLMRLFVVMTLVLACSCEKQTQDDNQSRKEAQGVTLSGTWQGTVTEKGKSTLVELSLQEKDGKIEGKLTVLGETGGDVDQGMNFTLVQVERSNDRLKFIMPVGGEGDGDNVTFDLRVEGNRLEGTAHEMRKGSKDLPVTFTKKEL